MRYAFVESSFQTFGWKNWKWVKEESLAQRLLDRPSCPKHMLDALLLAPGENLSDLPLNEASGLIDENVFNVLDRLAKMVDVEH